MSPYPTDPVIISRAGTSPYLDRIRKTHLRLVEADDASYLVKLRTDPALSAHLSAGDFSVEGQRQWIRGYKEREARGEEYYFILISDGREKGAVRLYDFRSIAGQISFCFGSWIVEPPREAGLTTYAFIAAMGLGFDVLKFPGSHFDVRRDNVTAIGFYERAGAERVGETSLDFYYQFSAEAFENLKERSANQIARHQAIDSSD